MNPRAQTVKQLTASGYELKRHGANHDIYYNTQHHTGQATRLQRK